MYFFPVLCLSFLLIPRVKTNIQKHIGKQNKQFFKNDFLRKELYWYVYGYTKIFRQFFRVARKLRVGRKAELRVGKRVEKMRSWFDP